MKKNKIEISFESVADTSDVMDVDGAYKRLGTTVIMQAVMDYNKCRLQLPKAKDEKVKELKREMDRIERFFLSEEFKLYCRFDGRTLLKALKEKGPRRFAKRYSRKKEHEV